jgi:hypothetical protein
MALSVFDDLGGDRRIIAVFLDERSVWGFVVFR